MTKTELEIISTVLGWADKRSPEGICMYAPGGPLTTNKGSRRHKTALELEKQGLVNVHTLGNLVRITSAVQDWKDGEVKQSPSLDDAQAERIGEVLAANLRLKRDPDTIDRWVTAWGTITNKGLARTMLATITQLMELK